MLTTSFQWLGKGCSRLIGSVDRKIIVTQYLASSYLHDCANMTCSSQESNQNRDMTEVLKKETHTQREQRDFYCVPQHSPPLVHSSEEDLALPNHEWDISRSEVVH